MHYLLLSILFIVLCSCKAAEVVPTQASNGGVFDDGGYDPLVPEGNNSNFIAPKDSEPGEDDKKNTKEEKDQQESPKTTSSGTGGQKGRIVNGLRHEHNSLSSQYRVWAPANNSSSSPHSLVVYLHGNTGSNFGPASLDPNIVSQFAAFGQGLPTLDQAVLEGQNTTKRWAETIFVSVLTPTINSSRTLTWSTDLSTQLLNNHAAFLHDLIQNKIFSQYNVDLENVFFAGQSGGAFFLSSTFITKYGHHYKGGIIMLCGGEPAIEKNDVNELDKLKEFLPLHFETTINEDSSITQEIIQSRDYYTDLLGSDRVTYVRQGNGQHCVFDTNSQPIILDRVISKMQKLNNN